MMSEGQSTVMETVMGDVVGRDLVDGDRTATNKVSAMLKTGVIRAGMGAVSHAHAAAVARTTTATTMATPAMGRCRDHRTGRDDRRRGQRHYRFA